MKKNIKNSLKNNRGLTLLELVVTIIVSSILVLATTPFARQVINNYIIAAKMDETHNAGRVALNRLTSEVRMIQGLSNITSCTSNSIQFTNKDNQTISYSYNSSDDTLLRNGYVCAKSVSEFQIYMVSKSGYYTWFGDPNLWSFQFTMTITVHIGDSDRPLTFLTTVTPRQFE